jgi:hypothetical protein
VVQSPEITGPQSSEREVPMLQTTKASLNASVAEFKAPSSTNGSTTVTDTTVGATIPFTDVAYHVTAINHLIIKLKRVTDEFKETTAEIEEAIGQHIKAIKIAEANNWESVVRAKCGLSRSRAYELMTIADGIKTAKQVRYETNVRKIRHRQTKPSVPGTDRKELAVTDAQVIELKVAHRRELADARAQLDEREEAHKRQITRFEDELAKLSDARNLGSERDQLRKSLGEITDLLAEMRGLMTNSVRNRTTIIAKITRAEKIATSVSKPAKGAIVNLPVKQVA